MITPLTWRDAMRLQAHLERHHAENEREVFSAPQSLGDWLGSVHVRRWESPVDMVGWQRAWAAWFDDEIVACCFLTGNPYEPAAHRCTLGLGVEKRARRRGIGRALMGVALEWARVQTLLRWVDAVTLEPNTPMLALEHSVGFRVAGSVADSFVLDGKSYTQVLLALDLRAGGDGVWASE